MRNGNDRDLPFELQYGIRDALFRLRIESGRRFIEDQDFRLLIEGARDADALALSAGELDAALADHRLDSLRLRMHKRIELRHGKRLMDTGIINLFRRLTQRHILADGRVGQIDGLRDIGDVRLPCTKFLANVYAIDRDLAARGDEKSQEDIDERGLSRARWTENADKLPFRYREADILEHLIRSARIAEPQMLHTNHIGKGKRRRQIGDLEFSLVVFARFDREQFAVQFIKQRELEFDAVRKRYDAVRARHQAEGGKRQDAEQWDDFHRRISHDHLPNDEKKQCAYDERLDDHARELVQKHELPGRQSIFFVVLHEFLKEELLLAHDLRFFDRPQPLIHGLNICRSIRVLYLPCLSDPAPKRTKQCVDQSTHDACHDDRRERVCKDQHPPDGQCRDDLRQKLECGNQNIGKYDDATAIDVSQEDRRVVIQMKEIRFGKVTRHQFLGKLNLVENGKIDLQAELPSEIEILQDIEQDEQERESDDQLRMRRDPKLRRIRCDLCMVRQEVRLPHEGDERQDRPDADRLKNSASHHHRNEEGTIAQFLRRKDGKNLKK